MLIVAISSDTNGKAPTSLWSTKTPRNKHSAYRRICMIFIYENGFRGCSKDFNFMMEVVVQDQ